MLSLSVFRKQLEQLVQFPEKNTYLLAVSGGADSMVMAYLFNALKPSGCTFQVAHVNYKLRGEDSEQDRQLAEKFCAENGIPFHLHEVSGRDRKPDHSIQLWARELRYDFFKQVQKKENLKFLVTAHHLNDQLETFIINLSKAAGINGLSGIPADSNHILRPLLPFSKEEIYTFAKEHQIGYREDLSNKKNDYLRNKIRNEVVPKLMETNDHFLDNFGKSISYLNQARDFIQRQIGEIENRITLSGPSCRILSKEQLGRESDFVKFEILKKYGFDQEQEIHKIFSAGNGSSFYSNEYRLLVEQHHLTLIRRQEETSTADEEIMLIENFDFSENRMAMNLENITGIEEINKSFSWDFDARKLRFPLQLRRAGTGDKFYPAGFSGKKKISKFFRDEKIAILARPKIWVLSDAENSVLGILPYRQDRRYMRDENTVNILTIFNISKDEV